MMPSLPVTEKTTLPDDVPDADLGNAPADGLHGQEDVLDGEDGGGDRGAEEGALEPVGLEDALGADAGRRGSDHETGEGEQGQPESGPAGTSPGVAERHALGDVLPGIGRVVVSGADTAQGGGAAAGQAGGGELLVHLRVPETGVPTLDSRATT
jgi:hypothetical protein